MGGVEGPPHGCGAVIRWLCGKFEAKSCPGFVTTVFKAYDYDIDAILQNKNFRNEMFQRITKLICSAAAGCSRGPLILLNKHR